MVNHDEDLAVVPKADQPTLTPTRTRTRTLWGDQCLDAGGGVQSVIFTPLSLIHI